MRDENYKMIKKAKKHYKSRLYRFILKIAWPFFERNWNQNKVKPKRIYFIGQSHIDAAWLWLKETSIKKVFITFSKAIRHIKTYPNFTFSASSPLYYEWMQINYPDLFKEIKHQIKCNRFEIVGGSWIEPDANIPSGESFIRQRLIGQRYYLKNFGKISEVEWYLDSFGYSSSLPQIFKKSGAKYFWSVKLKSNKDTYFPFNYFKWEGIDGSKVLVTQVSGGYGSLMEGRKSLHNYKLIKKGENLIANYETSLEEIDKKLSDEFLPINGIFYGRGDGGHGPWEKEVVEAELISATFKRYRIGKAQDYFRDLEQYKDRLATWNDDLYYEYHRGTYTSFENIKWQNWKSELLFFPAEQLALYSAYFNGNNNVEEQYPAELFQKLWKDLLFNQFHDVLAGTSIPEVYNEAEIEQTNIHKKLNSINVKCIQNLLEFANMNMKFNENNNFGSYKFKEDLKNTEFYNTISFKNEDIIIFIFNPLPYKIKNIFQIYYPRLSFINAKTKVHYLRRLIDVLEENENLNLKEKNNQEKNNQEKNNQEKNNQEKNNEINSPIELINSKGKLEFIAEIPANSLSAFYLFKGNTNFNEKQSNLITKNQDFCIKNVSIKGPSDKKSISTYFEIENKYFIIRINKESGQIDEIFYKMKALNKREELRKSLIEHGFVIENNDTILVSKNFRLRLYGDKAKNEPAWNIEKEYKQKEEVIPPPIFTKVIDDTPIKKSIAVKYIFKIEKLKYLNIEEEKFKLKNGKENVATVIRDSEIELIYSVYPNIPYIIVNLNIDWHIPEHFLKAEIEIPQKMERIISGLSFGMLNSSAHPKEPWDRARWEKCAHRFISYSFTSKNIITEIDNSKINENIRPKVAFLTKFKYGFSHYNNKIALSLLRTPLFPDPDPTLKENKTIIENKKKLITPLYQDFGNHFIEFAIFPYSGNIEELNRQAEIFNTEFPLIISELSKNDLNKINKKNLITILEHPLFVTTNSSSINLSAIKKHEDSDSMILRLVESIGKETTAEINIFYPFSLKKKNATKKLDHSNIEFVHKKIKAIFSINLLELKKEKIEKDEFENVFSNLEEPVNLKFKELPNKTGVIVKLKFNKFEIKTLLIEFF
ncbi:MAG: alpha-mannosidase [Promethearchaeota archaeon]